MGIQGVGFSIFVLSLLVLSSSFGTISGMWAQNLEPGFRVWVLGPCRWYSRRRVEMDR